MNAIVVRSPRRLAKPRRVQIVKHTPAVATVFQGVATTMVRGFRGAAALAVRAHEAAADHSGRVRRVDARQVDTPQRRRPTAPAPSAKPRQVRVRNFLDMFD